MSFTRLGRGLVTLWMLATALPAAALNEKTHAIVNEQAARLSQLDQVLRAHFAFREGLETRINGRAAREWLGEGGVKEDSPMCRSARHFHDPLKAWNQAGLDHALIKVLCVSSAFPSSLVWSQTD